MVASWDAVREVPYISLNPKQKEQFNFQKIAATLAEYGFNCIKLADDWMGAGFLAYHVNKEITLKVQPKSRLVIDGKYTGKDIWMAFPYKGYRYLIKHDELVRKAGESTRWLKSPSWKGDQHWYSSDAINKTLLDSLDENRIGPVYGSGPPVD